MFSFGRVRPPPDADTVIVVGAGWIELIIIIVIIRLSIVGEDVC